MTSARLAKRQRQRENRREGRTARAQAASLALESACASRIGEEGSDDVARDSCVQQRLPSKTKCTVDNAECDPCVAGQSRLVVKHTFIDVHDEEDVESQEALMNMPEAEFETTADFEEWRRAYRKFRFGYHRGAKGEASLGAKEDSLAWLDLNTGFLPVEELASHTVLEQLDLNSCDPPLTSGMAKNHEQESAHGLEKVPCQQQVSIQQPWVDSKVNTTTSWVHFVPIATDAYSNMDSVISAVQTQPLYCPQFFPYMLMPQPSTGASNPQNPVEQEPCNELPEPTTDAVGPHGKVHVGLSKARIAKRQRQRGNRRLGRAARAQATAAPKARDLNIASIRKDISTGSDCCSEGGVTACSESETRASSSSEAPASRVASSTAQGFWQTRLVVKHTFIDVDDEDTEQGNEEISIPAATFETNTELEGWRRAYRKFRLGSHRGAKGEAFSIVKENGIAWVDLNYDMLAPAGEHVVR